MQGTDASLEMGRNVVKIDKYWQIYMDTTGLKGR